jgi:hypothetical protein
MDPKSYAYVLLSISSPKRVETSGNTSSSFVSLTPIPTELHYRDKAMHTFILAARGILEHNKDQNKSNSKHTCPTQNTDGPTIVPFIGNLRYHQFAAILSGSCAILSTIIVGTLVATHAFNYSNPVQQRQIIRILLLIPWVALFSFLVVWRDDAGEYLAPSLDFGCSVALSSFLLFMCDLVLSHRTGFDDMFGQGAQAKGALDGKSPFWLKVRYISCFHSSKSLD